MPTRLAAFWRRSALAKIVIVVVGLTLSCCVLAMAASLLPEGAPTPTPAALAQVESTVPAATATPAATVTPRPTSIPTRTPSPLEALRAAIVADLGQCNREGVERVASIEIDADRQIVARFAINDNLFESSIVRGAKGDVVSILHAVAQSGIDYAAVQVWGTFSMQDKYGNASESGVVQATYSAETIGKINFDNFDPENIYEIADQWQVHHLFR